LHLHDTPEISGAILFTIPSPNGEPNGKARIGDQIKFGSGSAGLGSIAVFRFMASENAARVTDALDSWDLANMLPA
jgi:hypothetical protein